MNSEEFALMALCESPLLCRTSSEFYGTEPDEFLTISATQHQRTSENRWQSPLAYRDWLDLMSAHRGRCLYCGRADRMQVDHIVPVASGGGNEASNLAPACKPCNFDKRALPLRAWLARRTDLSPRDIASRWAEAGRRGELPL